jgi:hypothetical protein
MVLACCTGCRQVAKARADGETITPCLSCGGEQEEAVVEDKDAHLARREAAARLE